MRVLGLLALVVATGIVATGVSTGCAFTIETTGTGGYGGGGTVAIASSGTGWATGTTGTTGTGGGSSGGGGVAAPCQADADCAMGLACLVDTTDDAIFGGGPVGGFCTRSCDADMDCAEAGATCFKLDPAQPGRCTLSCTIGPPIESVSGFFDPLAATKCLGREDLRCGKAKNGVGVCLPTCGDDKQCHGGRSCDPRLAVCVAQPNPGQPLGTACQAGEEPSTCGGLCVGFDSGVAMCSSPCVLGGDKLSTSDCGGPAHGFCAFRAQPNGTGDVGYCTPSCEAHDECPSPSFWCFAFAGLTEIVGKGYCFAATTCPNGQVDCASTDVCTDTDQGPYCLDKTFPFSNSGTGGGGTGGGGTGGNGTGGNGGAGGASSSSGSGGSPGSSGSTSSGGGTGGSLP